MNFMKKLFEGKADDSVHRQFKRFSKGVFDNRGLVEVSRQKSKVKVKTSFEYTNDLVRYLADTIEEVVVVKGAIITTKDLREEIEFKNVKQYMGVKTFEVDQEMSKENILSLIEKYPNAVFCLSFNTNYGKIKVKVKPPKSGKPLKKAEEKPKADYCVFETKDLGFWKEFLFDVDEDFSKAFVTHTFEISELIVPDEYKNDFSLAREHAVRKGKVIRKISLDGKEIVKEIDFEA